MPPASYDEIAQWYDESVRQGSLIHDLVVPVLLDLMGDIQGKHICDLACGQGTIARQLAKRGAIVVGVDLSANLLKIARHEEEAEPPDIVYLQDDAQTLSSLEDATFDGVLCNMSLMDIPDIAATFRAVRRILRPGGWFVFSITHPCFQTPQSEWIDKRGGTPSRVVSGYFDEVFWRSDNPQGVRGQVGAYHRTLSTYINALIDAGLALQRLLEPRATGNIAERLPGYREVPAVLILKCYALASLVYGGCSCCGRG